MHTDVGILKAEITIIIAIPKNAMIFSIGKRNPNPVEISEINSLIPFTLRIIAAAISIIKIIPIKLFRK